MANDYTNVIDKTNLPLYNDIDRQISRDRKQQRFFGNFYSSTPSVDPAEYEIIRGFLISKNIQESAVDNLAITLAEVAKEQNLKAQDIIDLANTDSNNIDLNTILCILLNTTRNRTSVLGFNKVQRTDNIVQRNIIP